MLLFLPALALAQEPTTAANGDDEEDEATLRVETSHRVGGALADGPARVESIGSDDLERRGVTNLAEALEWLSAGSQVTPTGSATGLLVDGLPASHVTVLRDGLPISRAVGSPQGPLVDLSAIALAPDAIERIDIYRGVGPVGTGSVGGVVIDVISKTGKRPSRLFAQSRMMIAGDDARRPTATTLSSTTHTVSGQTSVGEHVGVEALGQFTDTAALDVNADGKPDSPALAGINGELALTWRPQRESHLRLQLLGSQVDTESLGGRGAIFDDLVQRDSLRTLLAGRWWLNDDMRIDHRSDFGASRHDFLKRVVSSGFERPKALTNYWNTTHNVAGTWFAGRHDLAAEVSGGGYVIERDGETGVLPTKSQGQFGVGVADTWYATDDLELFGRLFGELSTSYGAALNAQLSGTYRVVDVLSFRSALSTTRRAPTPEELYLFFDHSEIGYQVTGNEALQPETLYSAQLATLVHAKDRSAGLEVMGFYHYLTDAITTVGVEGTSGLFSYDNLAAAHTAGLQGSAEWAIVKSLTLTGNYTWMPLAKDTATDTRLPLRPEHAARVELRKTFWGESVQLWADAALRSNMPVPDGSAPADGYALLGVGASAQVGDYRLIVDLNNLLDHKTPDWGPLPGRNLMITLQGSLNGAPRTP